MKTRFVTIILLVVLVVLVGCTNLINQKTTTTSTDTTDHNGQTTITKKEDFLSLYKEWTSRLETIANKTNNNYSDWINGKIDTEQFTINNQQIYNEIKQLKNESDLKTDFNLVESDKQKVNFEAVTNAYIKACKDLNDFFYFVPHLSDDEIKSKYEELIKDKYNSDVSELKKLLKM